MGERHPMCLYPDCKCVAAKACQFASAPKRDDIPYDKSIVFNIEGQRVDVWLNEGGRLVVCASSGALAIVQTKDRAIIGVEE